MPSSSRKRAWDDPPDAIEQDKYYCSPTKRHDAGGFVCSEAPQVPPVPDDEMASNDLEIDEPDNIPFYFESSTEPQQLTPAMLADLRLREDLRSALFSRKDLVCSQSYSRPDELAMVLYTPPSIPPPVKRPNALNAFLWSLETDQDKENTDPEQSSRCGNESLDRDMDLS